MKAITMLLVLVSVCFSQSIYPIGVCTELPQYQMFIIRLDNPADGISVDKYMAFFTPFTDEDSVLYKPALCEIFYTWTVTSEYRQMSAHIDLKVGKYMVNIVACNDCGCSDESLPVFICVVDGKPSKPIIKVE